MNVSDGMDKSWERSWTTEEMRNKRQEWSLAGDAGLLKHLQQFSENLVSKANKTQEAIDSLTTQLNETAIFIDNVTNTSLVLANTQFIESRVQEDDVEIEKKVEDLQKDSKEQDLSTTDFIASISENIKQGLSIMDEKYKRMEVVDSDSEDEEDARVMSVILGPEDPYQDRPLPYIIGSDKWNASDKIGLESSSSESEQVDEEEDDSESDKDEKRIQEPFNPTNGPRVNIPRLSSSSSESERSNDAPYMNHGKLDSISQNTMSFASDSTTPINDVSKVQVPNETPNFAEELAKRLGNVRQAQKPPIMNETREPSINKFKDELFTSEDNTAEDFFSNKSNNLFDNNKGLFGHDGSAKLWKEQPIFQSNIIPPSLDVPPPISTILTKPKSTIDDLFADGDSEDSNDIFSSKQPVKRITKDGTSENKQSVNAENVQKKLLDVGTTKSIQAIATSTPEMNVNAGNLFSDEEEDYDDLFATSKKQPSKPVDGAQDRTAPQDNNEKKSVGGISILGGMLASGGESTLSNRLPRRQSSDSSSSDTIPNSDVASSKEPLFEGNSSSVASDNVHEHSSNVVEGNRVNWNFLQADVNDVSSGISIQPPSISSTMSSRIWSGFGEISTSTRLNSEDIYRERFVSDSLFVANASNPHSMNASSQRNDRLSVEQRTETSSAALDDVFENEDLFGPPPLPKTDSKPTKSKASSLFDDSDSGEELFSTTSSGSRSQKSTDFVATTPQYPEKNKFSNRRGLFDDDIDIFGNKDSPDVDIFGITPKPYKDNAIGTKRVPEISSDNLSADKTRSTNSSRDSATVKLANTNSSLKNSSLFDNDGEEDGKDDKQGDGMDEDDLFAVKKGNIQTKVVESKTFVDDPENDLFSTKPSSSRVVPVGVKNLSGEKEFDRKVEDAKPSAKPSAKPNTKPKTSLPTEIPKEIPKEKPSGALSANGQPPLFEDDDDYEDLFVKRSEDKVRLENEEDKSDKPDRKHKTGSVASKEDELSRADVVNSSDNDVENKKHPPTTLNIRAATSSPPDDNLQAPRRAVSGKIKNLMGKMGDLKILSPTDTPPLWRKSEERTDEEDGAIDRDSDDGGCVSTQVPISSIGENEAPKPPPSTTGTGNSETAISFDVPAQVETLSTTASKSRVRIQAKRRPQSRHARKSALRQSGIDFDTVDAAKQIPRESSDPSKESYNATTLGVASNVDRLASSFSNLAENIPRNADSSVSIADDKSEVGSISKESSMSANKHTLLSPSTDEEDLFDVPPDLPEDPQKEDALFGRAPILSPIQSVLPDREPTYGRPLRDTIIGGNDDNGDNVTQKESARSEISSRGSISSIAETNLNFDMRDEISDKLEARAAESKQEAEVQEKRSERFEETEDETGESTSDVFEEEYSKGPIDPLHDNSYDPLKDPSQLFAFVTKTPSPDKGKDLLFSDDDSSLFSSTSSKTRGEESGRKHVSDLFADDAGGDLFSVPLNKSVKKPLKDTKISFLDSKEEDGQNYEENSLFGTITKKVSAKSDEEKANVVATKAARKKNNIFQDDDEDGDVDNLFAEQPIQVSKVESAKVPRLPEKDEAISSGDKSVKTSKLSDIFGDQSSTDDDIFSSIKPVSKKVVATKQLFPEDSDDDDSEIFRKSSSLIESKANESRPIVKKSVTRDLKKTAEKIVEDPLSIFQDD